MSFLKNDNSFICENCGKVVPKLKTSSRDHCNNCLCSIHIDNDPGDRLNECHGIMKPIGIEQSSKKGYVIIYKCSKCGAVKKNKAATDDNFDEILKISSKFN